MNDFMTSAINKDLRSSVNKMMRLTCCGRITAFLAVVAVVAVTAAGCANQFETDPKRAAAQGGKMEYISTFKIGMCDQIDLENYKKISDFRDGAPANARPITDPAVIRRITGLMSALPDTGDEMIKMGNAPMLNVILKRKNRKPVYFAYYDKRVKTPDTSFIAVPPKEEEELYSFLSTLLEL